MSTELFNRLEKAFYEYTEKYDENIISLVKEREVEISVAELKEILQDAKNLTSV